MNIANLNRIIYTSVIVLILISPLRLSAQNHVADFTVIFCGMPERVEKYALEELADILRMRNFPQQDKSNGEIGPNVNFAGLLKLGESSDSIFWQKEMAPWGYDGTVYIDLGTKSAIAVPPLEGDTINIIAEYLRDFGARKYADKYFRFFNTDSLALLIKEVAASHPAKNYILCLLGHGSGKYCMRDDYYPGRRGITAEELDSAIEKSGVRIHTLFFHNCMIGTIENLATYQHCARYAFLSPEVTSGGYIPHYLANLSKAGDDPDKTIELTKETVDFYKKITDKEDEINTSQGFYDLSKMKDLLDIVRNVSEWYSNAVTEDSLFVGTAVRSAITCYGLEDNADEKADTCLAMQRWILKHMDANYLPLKNLSSEEKDTLSQYASEISKVKMDGGLILSHLIYQTINLSKTIHTTCNIMQLQTLYERYMSKLKDMAYIRCNHVTGSMADYDYLYASPAVSVFRMDEESAKHYEKSAFDRATHWSSFLRKLRATPSYLTNLSRTAISKYQH